MRPERHVALIGLRSRCCMLGVQTTSQCPSSIGTLARPQTLPRDGGDPRTNCGPPDHGQRRQRPMARAALGA